MQDDMKTVDKPKIVKPNRHLYLDYNGVLGRVISASDDRDVCGSVVYSVECASCGEVHGRTARQLKGNVRSTDCEHYRSWNWSGLHARDVALRRQYGITLQEYNELSAFQGHACAMCGIDEESNGKKFTVDHDHTTNEVRGLLCSRCNSALGILGDTLQDAANAYYYLKNTPYNEYKENT
jgi:hypothetical protein